MAYGRQEHHQLPPPPPPPPPPANPPVDDVDAEADIVADDTACEDAWQTLWVMLPRYAAVKSEWLSERNHSGWATVSVRKCSVHLSVRPKTRA